MKLKRNWFKLFIHWIRTFNIPQTYGCKTRLEYRTIKPPDPWLYRVVIYFYEKNNLEPFRSWVSSERNTSNAIFNSLHMESCCSFNTPLVWKIFLSVPEHSIIHTKLYKHSLQCTQGMHQKQQRFGQLDKRKFSWVYMSVALGC